ncbi:MAG: DUF2207 domain-containing protein [Clostridiaceae bacterium]|nr:DUF2207 domain-containing protein [Clostridiaceae bacterium]
MFAYNSDYLGKKRTQSKCRSITALVVLLIVFFLRPASQISALDAFEVDSLHIDMVVGNDNTYVITETYEMDFSEERHGFIRSLPLMTYDNRSMLLYDIDVDAPFTTYRSGEVAEIKIGDPDVTVIGPQSYTIRYTYDIGEDNFSDMDELYFNLIGAEWDTYFHDVTFRIEMPYEFNADRLHFTSGARGSTETAPVDYWIEGSTIFGGTTSTLYAHEALTIALPLPEGYFDGALRPNKIFFYIYENYIYLGLLLISVIIALIARIGQRPSGAVEYYPPAGLNTCDMAYILNGDVREEDIATLIVSWASRGYLQLQEVEFQDGRRTRKDLMITKLRDGDNYMKPYERDLFDKLFTQNMSHENSILSSQLSTRFGRSMRTAMKRVKSYWNSAEGAYKPAVHLNQMYEDPSLVQPVFKSPFIWKLLVQLPGFAIIMLFFHKKALSNASDSVYMIWIYLFLMALFLYVLVYRPFAKTVFNLGKGEGVFRLIFKIIIFVAIGAFGVWMMEKHFGRGVPFGIAYITAAIPPFLAYPIKRRSKYGKGIYARCRGFQSFVKNAEQDRIIHLVGENPNYFFDVLPFASIMNITKVWADHFARIGAAARQPQTFGDYRREPSWWDYNDPYRYTTYMDGHLRFLNRDVNSSVKASLKEERAESSSSDSGGSGGSSSGGSSGGGSGGGGRSW